jgi:NAD(P)-dependent dehydrogenase (short-subunit alcohol dehydrogenase family)
MRNSLSGKVVFVTGAARGIGAETARVVAARGASVALAGLEAEQMASVASGLGTGHACFECDVTQQPSLDAAVAAAVERFGRLDVVVANAGVAAFGTVGSAPVDVIARVIEVNLIGAIRTSPRPCRTSRRPAAIT